VKLTRRQGTYLGLATAALLLVTLFVGLGINQSLYSASGFVSQYLSALSRHDAASALSMPGVGDKLPEGADRALLRGSAMGELSDITITQVSGNDTKTTVTASYLVGGEKATGEFVVTRLGNTMGFFESWAFAELPVAKAKVSVWHDSSFHVGNSGQIDLRSTDSAKDATVWGGTGTYLLFAPGNYVFDHSSTWLTAKQVVLNIASPGDTAEVVVDVQANKAFNKRVQKEVDDYLDTCVKERVLQPAGCPFGYQTSNRIVGKPTWEVDQYPVIKVVPGETTWAVRDAVGKLRITGEVQSLYDGTISPLDEIVDAVFNINISIRLDGNLAIVLSQ
jgi:hypothetical protein